MPQDETSTCTIFYSWQSQLPNSTNRSFIKEALERAVKAVKNDVTIDARPEIDQDTANVPGSPNIADTIRAKIDAAEVVVCDVSIVQGLDGDGERVRPTPNPNVLIELGYAMKSLGTTERLVLVMNTAYGAIKDLPFDLRQYRPTTYCLSEEATDKSAARKGLASKLEATFRHVFKAPSRHARPDASPTGKAPKPLVKVLVQGVHLRSAGGGPEGPRFLKIEVQNHSDQNFFFSSISFDIGDGEFVSVSQDALTKQPIVSQKIAPGDSLAHYFQPECFKWPALRNAVVYDKIGRTYLSDIFDFNDALKSHLSR